LNWICNTFVRTGKRLTESCVFYIYLRNRSSEHLDRAAPTSGIVLVEAMMPRKVSMAVGKAKENAKRETMWVQ
ncbi:MAG: hypothetical protein ACKO96_28795, partial [Flammeovirgaceae bacterium]